MGQLEDMEMFIRIVDAGSITRASEQLNIVKSAVSRRLKELEETLGVQLLTRTTRQSNLTEAGEYYYHRAQNILDEVKALNERTSGSKTSIGGTLKVSAPLSFGLMHFAHIIDEFASKHPNINFELDFSDRKVDLIEEGFELAIRIGNLRDSSHQAKRLTPIRFALCASPDYLAEKGIPKTIEDLEAHDFLQYGLDRNINLELTDKEGGIHKLPVSSKIKSTNGEFLIDMAIKNHGITFLPTFISYNALKSGKLVSLLTDYQLPSLTAYAVYPKNRFLSQRCRYFIDHLSTCFSHEPYWEADL